MDFEGLVGMLICVCVAGYCGVLVVLRCRGRRWSKWGLHPGAARLGNALHHLQTIVQPEVRYVIAEKLEEAEEEDSGDADLDGVVDPIRHLHRQAARIRRGETVDRITALLR